MRASLGAMIKQVRAGTDTDTIVGASTQIAAGNLDLSGRTEEQAAALEGIAATMETATGSVRKNADNAQQANQLAASASQIALKGGAVVAEVVGTMDQVTQQNAALVEQAAAAADSLQDQARELSELVGVFKLDDDGAAPVGGPARQAAAAKPAGDARPALAARAPIFGNNQLLAGSTR